MSINVALLSEEARRQLLDALKRPVRHEHCYRPFGGPIHMVLPNGHVLMKCCHCESTETRHAAHVHMVST